MATRRGEGDNIPILEGIAGPATGTRLPIWDRGLRIGRSDSDTPELAFDQELSGQHAEISWAAGQLVIRDLGSRNGTWVNDQKIGQPRQLQWGDRIALGNTLFQLISMPAAGQARGYDHSETRPWTPPAGQGGVAIQGGMHASDRGVAVGRDIYGGVITGDTYDIEHRWDYDPTGFQKASGIARLLLIVGTLVALAGFALVGLGFADQIAVFGETQAAHDRCDERFELGPERVECHLNVGSPDFTLSQSMIMGGGLFFGGMVIYTIGRMFKHKDEPQDRVRRGR